MEIRKNNRLMQIFCRHDYQEGIVSRPGAPVFFVLGGVRLTTICVRCGKVKSSRFMRNLDE